MKLAIGVDLFSLWNWCISEANLFSEGDGHDTTN